MRKLVTVRELADFCDVPVKTVYEWNSKGTGPRYRKLGVHVRYSWDDIEKWMASRAVDPSGQVA